MLITEPQAPARARAVAPLPQIDHFINGGFVASDRRFDKRSPVDGSVIARVAEASREQVDAAVRAARAALHGPWGALSVAQRVDLLYAVADGINRRFDDFLAAEV